MAQAQCHSNDSFAHEVLPDNAGGFVVTNECSGAFASRFDSNNSPVGAAVSLPFSELLSYPWDNTGDAVLSENYLFVQGDGHIVGMHLTTAALDLDYTCTAECRIISAAVVQARRRRGSWTHRRARRCGTTIRSIRLGSFPVTPPLAENSYTQRYRRPAVRW